MRLHQILIVALALVMLAVGGWAAQGMRRLPHPRSGYRVCGKPRSIRDVAGSGQRDVTTLPCV
jgi:hypothetical protein